MKLKKNKSYDLILSFKDNVDYKLIEECLNNLNDKYINNAQITILSSENRVHYGITFFKKIKLGSNFISIQDENYSFENLIQFYIVTNRGKKKGLLNHSFKTVWDR